MEKKYFDQLDETAKALVQELEAAFAQEIGVVVDDSKLNFGCGENNFKPIIYIPHEDQFPSPSVFHELLHIQRSYLQVVPSLNDNVSYEHWNEHTLRDLRVLDNNIEHLIILPLELEQYPQRKEFWTAKTNDALNAIGAISNKDIKTHNLCQQYPLAQLVLQDSEIIGHIKDISSEMNLGEKLDRLVDEVEQSLESKEMLVQTFFSYLERDLEMVELSYCNCVEKTHSERLLK